MFRRIIIIAVAIFVCATNVVAQTKTITMQRAIMLAQQQSIASIILTTVNNIEKLISTHFNGKFQGYN